MDNHGQHPPYQQRAYEAAVDVCRNAIGCIADLDEIQTVLARHFRYQEEAANRLLADVVAATLAELEEG